MQVLKLALVLVAFPQCFNTHLASAESPLDPLSKDEIELVGRLLRDADKISIISIATQEPTKANPEKYRRALAIIITKSTGIASEVIVNLSSGRIESRKDLPDGTQPMLVLDEFDLISKVLEADRDVRRRVEEQGLTMDLIMFDIWTPGDKCAGHSEFCGKRLAQSYVYFREFPEDNFYAHPLNFVIIVDVLDGRVLSIDELPVYENYSRPVLHRLRLPHKSANYDPRLLPASYFRKGIRPLTTTSLGGPTFTITDGYRVDWQGWRLRIGFNAREGLTLHDISYKEEGHHQRRSLLYRVAISELIVPYSDPRPPYSRKGAFDLGEYGLATDINELIPGVDCLPQSHLIDVYLNDINGHAVKVPNAICISEIDSGVLHRHVNDAGKVTVARAQSLDVMFSITSSNYDYSFHFIFHQDGTIDIQTGLTGILSTNLLMQGKVPWASTVAEKVIAQFHQHIFCIRMDTAFDGEKNSISLVDVEPMPDDPVKNPAGNGFVAKERLLTTSLNSVTDASIEKNRVWKVFNPESVDSITGAHKAYKIITNNRALLLATENSSFAKRGGFAKHSIWAIPYKEDQLFAAGKYPNQNEETDGIALWVKKNENIVGKDLVVFASFGFTHIPTTDEYPLMGMEKTGITLRPCNFFQRNPGLTVPPPPELNLSA